MKTITKTLISIMAILFITLLIGTTNVKAAEITKEYLDNMITVLPETISVNLKESDFGEKTETEVEKQIKKIWEEKQIDTTEIKIYVSTSYLSISKVSVQVSTDPEKPNYLSSYKLIDVIYSNSNVNNEADKEEFKRLTDSFTNENSEYWKTIYVNMGEEIDDDKIREEALKEVINNSDYTVKCYNNRWYNSPSGALENNIVCGVYVFKNDKLCGEVDVGINRRPIITVPDNIKDDETSITDYAKSVLTGYQGTYFFVIKKINKLEKISGYYYKIYYEADPSMGETWTGEEPEYLIIKKADGVSVGNNIYVDGLDEGININVIKKDNLNVKAEAIDKGYLNILGSYEVTVKENKEINNPINVTFKVGTDYNDKTICIVHQKKNGSYETFEKVAKNGKVTVTVNELSPFVLAVKGKLTLGDLNGDEKVNAKDARNVLLAYIGKNTLTDEQKNAADVNHDGKVNAKDARQILLYYIGKIKTF